MIFFFITLFDLGKTPSNGTGMVTRRQTLTGIRTLAGPSRLNSPTEAASRRASLNNKRQSPLVKAEPIYSNVQDEPIYDNVEIIKQTKKTNIENVKTPSRRTNTPKGTVTVHLFLLF